LIICKKADLLCYSSPLDLFQLKNQYDIGVNVMGGGLVGQADAITLAIARALCKIAYRGSFKLKGLLTRDARVKERKNMV
jgi:small subunit ribosomal protein S9